MNSCDAFGNSTATIDDIYANEKQANIIQFALMHQECILLYGCCFPFFVVWFRLIIINIIGIVMAGRREQEHRSAFTIHYLSFISMHKLCIIYVF